LFNKRIGGIFVVVVVVEDGLGERAHKNLFSHKKKFLLLNDNKG
jgi:hypothetical protein